MDPRRRREKIEEHLAAIQQLEAQSVDVEEGAGETWPPNRYYFLWHIVIGMLLGGAAALFSLGANVIGAPLFGQRPLQLIRVYLTFPMGARALEAEEGLVVFVGCTLYLLTGALYGIAFHLVMSLFFAEADFRKRFLVATAIGLSLWIVNFYLILSWLQPLLLGGNWIVSMVPFWVGALTHLAFAWVMLAGETWGQFEPYTPRRTSADRSIGPMNKSRTTDVSRRIPSLVSALAVAFCC